MGDEREPGTPSLAAKAIVCALGTGVALAVMFIVVCVWHRYARMNDFRSEAWPAYRALEHWHIAQFLRLSPAYVGSLILRAPFLPLAGLLGHGWRAAYFATALPCVLAAPILGIWLSSQPRARIGDGVFSRVSPIVLCAVNPIVFVCIGFGHAEDVLGASLCVAAVVLAVRGSSGWAGLLIGVAIVNKSWALVAMPVVFAVMPHGRPRAAVIMCVTAGAILVPTFAVRESLLGAAGAAGSLGSQTGHIFLIPQLLFWLGPRSWIVHEAHVLIVLVAFVCAGAWWVIRGRVLQRRTAHGSTGQGSTGQGSTGQGSTAHGSTDPTEALLLLMLVLFLRAALDPWDNLYYQTPFLFALMAYEARSAPRLTAFFSCVLLVVVPPQILGGSRDFEAGLYSAVAGCTIVVLGLRVYLSPATWASLRARIMPGRAKAATAYGP